MRHFAIVLALAVAAWLKELCFNCRRGGWRRVNPIRPRISILPLRIRWAIAPYLMALRAIRAECES